MNHISERPSEPGAVRTRKPRGQGASRRGEILEAAKRLFTEEGFAHATMRRIAAEVGVSPTALYLHFADKEAILKAIAEDFFSELLVRLRETQGNTGATLGRLQAGLRAYVEFGLERADEYRLTFQVRKARTMKDPCAETDIADLSFEVLVTSVQDLMQSGQFRPGDPMVVAEAIWVSMHGLTSAAIDLHDRMHSDLNKLIDTLIVAVLAGFAAREAVGGLV
jgi:AcrR family transcriptional regulator